MDQDARLHDKYGERDRSRSLSASRSGARAFETRLLLPSDATGLIRSGRVRLNGAVRSRPRKPVQLEKDRIEVDGRPLASHQSLSDVEQAARSCDYRIGRKRTANGLRVSELKIRRAICRGWRLSDAWIKPAKGLLLLTNDSEWAARVLAPATHLNKTYHVQIDRVADATLLESLSHGVKLEDGEDFA